MANLTRFSLRAIGTINYTRLQPWNPSASTERYYRTMTQTLPRGHKTVLCRSSVMLQGINHFCSEKTLTQSEIKRAVEDISDKFAEAMELMNDARSSVGTVYFSEDMDDTTAQVQETLEDYQALIAQLTEQQKKQVIQSIGLKMEELKAQMSLLEDLAKE